MVRVTKVFFMYFTLVTTLSPQVQKVQQRLLSICLQLVKEWHILLVKSLFTDTLLPETACKYLIDIHVFLPNKISSPL